MFKKCKSVQDYANIDLSDLEKLIHSCGLYKNKAQSIKNCAIQILEKFNGDVPKTMSQLLSLSGIGRKSANVILLEAFGIANGIAVDTHVKRISNRLGLSLSNNPEKIELDLLKIFPKEYLKDVNHLLIWHGRNICKSQSPKCNSCCIRNYCISYK